MTDSRGKEKIKKLLFKDAILWFDVEVGVYLFVLVGGGQGAYVVDTWSYITLI